MISLTEAITTSAMRHKICFHGFSKTLSLRRGLGQSTELGTLILLLMRGRTGGGFLLRSMRKVGRAILRGIARLGFERPIGGGLRAADLRGCRAAATATDVILGLGAVVSSILFHGLAIPACMVSCEILDLPSLRVDDIRYVFKVVVDELLVGLVD